MLRVVSELRWLDRMEGPVVMVTDVDGMFGVEDGGNEGGGMASWAGRTVGKDTGGSGTGDGGGRSGDGKNAKKGDGGVV